MEKKPATLPTATDWRAGITKETRIKYVRSIYAKLKEQWSAQCPDGDLTKINSHALEHEKMAYVNAKSKEQYFTALNRTLSRNGNHHESSSSQDRPAFSSDQSVVLIKKEGAFVSQPLPQMTNQPQRAVLNPRYQQPVVPNSVLQQHSKQLTPQPQPQPQPHEQLLRQKLNVRQTHQQFGIHNQRGVSPQNTLNSLCRPQNVQSQEFGIHMSPKMFTQHPKVVNLQPNKNLTTQVKTEVTGQDFQASTFSHQNHSVIEQHIQHQSTGVSAVSNGNQNAEDWHEQAFSEKQRLKRYLPLLKKGYEKASEQCMLIGEEQTEQLHRCKHHKDLLHRMMIFLEFPRDKIIAYTKEKFYGCMQTILKCVKAIENMNTNLANTQQSLHAQPGLTQSRMNPIQQTDNVNPHFQPVNATSTCSSDGSSPILPRETGSLRSEENWIQKDLLQNRQHSENIKPEFQPPCIQQKQKSTENIQAVNRSGMPLEYHLNSKFSPLTHEASQLSQIVEGTLPKNPCASLYGRRASPTPSSITAGIGNNSSNVSYLSSLNFQYSQSCNAIELLDSKKDIQVESHKIGSSSIMTSQLAKPTSPGNNGQLSTTPPPNPLLKAVESVSNEALRVAVSQICAVRNMEDTITKFWWPEREKHSSLQEGCGSSNNMEDTITEFGWQEHETYLSLQEGCGSSNNMKRKITATTLNDMSSSPCSDIIDGSGLTVTVTSRSKKLKKLSKNELLEEIRNINKQFIETVLEIDSDENANRRLANAGTVLRCSYKAASESKQLVFHPANTLKLPVLSVKLLVPLDYPQDYPVFLSKLITDCGTDSDDEESKQMSREARTLLSASLRAAPDSLSLEDYARVWDQCARYVVTAYAQRVGGGCFSSRYGTWEDCVAST